METTVMQERFFSPGMDIGVGVNLLTGEVLERGVTGVVSDPLAVGQTVESRIVRIDDLSSLHKSLQIDVSASGSYLGFSASAKMDYADSCGFNEHSIYLLVLVRVTNALTRMDTPALIPEATGLLRNKRPDRFRARFGDVFVAGIHTGGEYFAVFQITGTDESEKESLAVQVDASFTTIGAGANLSAAVNTAKSSSHSHLDMRVFTFQNGGKDVTQDQDPGQIMAKAKGFAQSIQGENAKFAVAYSILPESYLTLDLPGDADNPIDIENQKQMLATNFKLRNELMVLLNNMDYVLLSEAQNHQEFEPFDVAAMTQERNRLAGDMDRIVKEAAACMRDAQTCHLATFQPLAVPLPKKRTGTTTLGPKLDRDWVGGSASPQVSAIPLGPSTFIARGNMKLDLPHLSRLMSFRAKAKINSIVKDGFANLFVGLKRMALDGSNPQDVVRDTQFEVRLGMAEVTGFPDPAFEIIDMKSFQYFITAVYMVRNPTPNAMISPAEAVVWQSFDVEVSST